MFQSITLAIATQSQSVVGVEYADCISEER